MTVLLPSQITADTTKVTADTAINRPVTVMRTKLRALLPPWFIDDDPYLDGVLNGISTLLLFGQSLLAYARKQTRVATSTGGFLDLTAYDFFRNRIRRRPRERDADYQVRIRQEVIRPRATRAAIVRAVTELTGRVPDVIEPFNPGDCGAYGSGTIAYGGVAAVAAATSGYGSPFGGYGAGHFAYVVPGPVNGITGGAGCYGSLSLPNQIFIRVYRGPGTFANPGATGGYGSGTFAYGGGTDGVPALSGYGAGLGAYGVGSLCYGSPQPPYARFAGAGFYGSASERTSVTDAEIYDAIAETTAAGVTAWTMIRGI